MNIEISIGGPLAEAINRLADALVSAKQTDVIIEKASSKARAKKETPASAPEVPASEPEPAAAVVDVPAAPVEEKKEVKLEDLRATLTGLVKSGKKEAVVKLLEKFGASSVSAVKPADYAAVFAEAGKL